MTSRYEQFKKEIEALKRQYGNSPEFRRMIARLEQDHGKQQGRQS